MGGWVGGWVAETWPRPKLTPPPPGSLSNSLLMSSAEEHLRLRKQEAAVLDTLPSTAEAGLTWSKAKKAHPQQQHAAFWVIAGRGTGEGGNNLRHEKCDGKNNTSKTQMLHRQGTGAGPKQSVLKLPQWWQQSSDTLLHLQLLMSTAMHKNRRQKIAQGGGGRRCIFCVLANRQPLLMNRCAAVLNGVAMYWVAMFSLLKPMLVVWWFPQEHGALCWQAEVDKRF